MRIITIARPYGAGGHTVGQEVARRLGFDLVEEEEMINAVAKKVNVSPAWVRSIEKERGYRLMNFISNLVSPSLLERLQGDEKRGDINEDIYVETLENVMLEIAGKTEAVIVGRGGQYFLQNHPRAVHVLLAADKAYRVRFLEEHYDLNEARASQMVLRKDSRRNNFYKKIHHKHYNNPNLYTVVLNMTRISIDKAVDVISDLAKDM